MEGIGRRAFKAKPLVKVGSILRYRMHDHGPSTDAVRSRRGSQEGVLQERSPHLISLVIKIDGESADQDRRNCLMLGLAAQQSLGGIFWTDRGR